MNHTRIYTILIGIIIVLMGLLLYNNDATNMNEREYNVNLGKYLSEKEKFHNRILKLEEEKYNLNLLMDSIYKEVQFRDSIIKLKIDGTKTLIKNLHNETLDINSWSSVERDSFWSRESIKIEHIPHTPEDYNK